MNLNLRTIFSKFCGFLLRKKSLILCHAMLDLTNLQNLGNCFAKSANKSLDSLHLKKFSFFQKSPDLGNFIQIPRPSKKSQNQFQNSIFWIFSPDLATLCDVMLCFKELDGPPEAQLSAYVLVYQ